MASSGQIPRIFGEPSGLGESAIKRALAAHRAAGQIVSGGKGGGSAAVHFRLLDYAILFLGFAGAQPSDAGEAAATLAPFVWHSTFNHRTPTDRITTARVPGTAIEVLAALIGGGWGAIQEVPDQVLTFNFPDFLMSLHTPEVRVQWIGNDGYPEITEFYGPPAGVPYTPKSGGVLRQTQVKASLGLLANQLWRETPDNETAEVPASISAASRA